MATPVSFAQDILPLFTQIDIDHMQEQGVHLDQYSYMSTKPNAEAVYGQLSSKKMPPPPEGPWSDANIALFKSWIDDGCQP